MFKVWGNFRFSTSLILNETLHLWNWRLTSKFRTNPIARYLLKSWSTKSSSRHYGKGLPDWEIFAVRALSSRVKSPLIISQSCSTASISANIQELFRQSITLPPSLPHQNFVEPLVNCTEQDKRLAKEEINCNRFHLHKPPSFYKGPSTALIAVAT